MTDLRIVATMARTKPKYNTTAPLFLELCRKFYQDPENEKAYQEWRAQMESEKSAKAQGRTVLQQGL